MSAIKCVLVYILLLESVAGQEDVVSKLQNSLLILEHRMSTAESQLQQCQVKYAKMEQRLTTTQSQFKQSQEQLRRANQKIVSLEAQQQKTQTILVQADITREKNSLSIGDKIAKLSNNVSKLQASRSTTLEADGSKDVTVTYDKVLVNEGGGYNIQNGHFTAPVSGIYLFTYDAWNQSQKTMGVRLDHNGNYINSVHTSKTDIITGSSMTAVLKLTKGDNVWTSVYNGYAINANTDFIGLLLYQT